MKECVALDLRHPAAEMVKIVALHGDKVAGPVKVDTPIVVAIACCGVAGHTIDFTIGYCNAVRGTGSENNVLTANQRCRYMIDPDHIGVVDCSLQVSWRSATNKRHSCALTCDSISTPDVLRIDVCDHDVSSDHIRIFTRHHPERPIAY